MAIQIKHAFTSAKGDGTDATLVRPSNWNALHTTSMATLNLLGRATAGTGVFEELPTSAAVIALLAAADLATFISLIGGAETGDVKYTFKTSASAGWMLVTAAGSIGDASSTATLRANADTLALYTIIYNGCDNTLAPVAGGRGANAAADYAAHKAMTIPQLVGRSPIAAGAAAGVTTLKALGTLYGEENHALTSGENGPHVHANSLNDGGHTHQVGYPDGSPGSPRGFSDNGGLIFPTHATQSSTTGVTITNASSGSGTAHNTIHPVIGLNAMVKL